MAIKVSVVEYFCSHLRRANNVSVRVKPLTYPTENVGNDPDHNCTGCGTSPNPSSMVSCSSWTAGGERFAMSSGGKLIRSGSEPVSIPSFSMSDARNFQVSPMQKQQKRHETTLEHTNPEIAHHALLQEANILAPSCKAACNIQNGTSDSVHPNSVFITLSGATEHHQLEASMSHAHTQIREHKCVGRACLP